jgi:hypothetical protein
MKIKLLNKQWKIKEIGALEMANTMQHNSVYHMGACEFMTKTIYILSGVSKESYEETLKHELTHAILYESSIQQHLTDDQQEQYCDFVKFAYPIIEDVLKQIEKKA